MTMTPDEWAKQYPAAWQALCEKRAAVMPIRDVPIVHGSNEAFASAGGILQRGADGRVVEHVYWAEKHLSQRLDQPVPA